MQNFDPAELVYKIGVKQLLIERQAEVIEAQQRRIAELEANQRPPKKPKPGSVPGGPVNPVLPGPDGVGSTEAKAGE